MGYVKLPFFPDPHACMLDYVTLELSIVIERLKQQPVTVTKQKPFLIVTRRTSVT